MTTALSSRATSPDISTWRLRGTPADRLEVLIPTILYIVLSLGGLTTSSLGYDVLREDPANPHGFMIGQAQKIRSDEWRTQAPIELGVLARGHSTQSPLANSPDLIYQVPSGSPVESILFFDGNLLRLGGILPQSMLFSAFRWMPLYLFVLCLPPLLRRFGAGRQLSWAATGLALTAPASAWWSFMPIRILGYAATGCYLLVLARDAALRGRRVVSWLVAAGAGVATARLPGYYAPWGIVLGVPLVLATTAALLSDSRARRHAYVVLGMGALVGVAVLGGTFWENADALRSELSTVYPGLRRAGASAIAPFKVFGAPGMYRISGASPPVVTGTNYSEMTSPWNLTVLWALALLVAALRRGERGIRVYVAGILTLWATLFLLWCTVPLGDLGSHVPLFNLVTPPRAAQSLGYPALFAVCVLLSSRQPYSRATAVVSAIACGSVTLLGLVNLRTAEPTYPITGAALICVLVAGLVFAMTSARGKLLPILAVVGLSAAAVAPVNPLIRGFGDLRTSDAARLVQTYVGRSVAADWRIASDSIPLDALLVANGAPTVTGYQVTGPVRSSWNVIDPTNAYENEWNRGASYLRFDLTGPNGAAPVITAPNGDNILVRLNGCDDALRTLKVGYFFSTSPTPPDCFRRIDALRWSGRPAYVYAPSESPR